MAAYIIRLDDAAEQMNIAAWSRMEELLDRYRVTPLVGVIPDCKDPMMAEYDRDPDFWEKVARWIKKGWTIALHGYDHVYKTTSGGINPVQKRSEFAGLPLLEQEEKIRAGVAIFREHGIDPQVFFAPSHTFDKNTIRALRKNSHIRIISDTVANKPYKKYGMTFVPQQTGRARKLPLHTVTTCYHPNTMKDEDFDALEAFLKREKKRIIPFPLTEATRKESALDLVLRKAYFARRR